MFFFEYAQGCQHDLLRTFLKTQGNGMNDKKKPTPRKQTAGFPQIHEDLEWFFSCHFRGDVQVPAVGFRGGV